MLYLVVVFVKVLERDVDSRTKAHIENEYIKQEQCRVRYEDNQCAHHPVDLADKCLELEMCFNANPHV